MKKILVVDDEPSIVQSIRMLLKDSYNIVSASNADEAIDLFKREAPDLLLLDIIMPGSDGLEVLKIIRKEDPNTPVIVLTATKMVKPAVEAMKMGATDYITKPFNIDELRLIIKKSLRASDLEKVVEYLRSELDEKYKLHNIIGKSKAIREIYSKIEQIADTKTTVLITGESGTGKELVARSLHFNSSRREKPFVEVNCAAIPETLIESELFGHEKGAFTGAVEMKRGRFELADGGTLFLDEIGDMSMATQAKVLRVLQEQRFNRVGGSKTIQVDVRVIGASNKNLTDEIKKGNFREDLYYRINVIPLHIPPLRERKEDIGLLVKSFLIKISEEQGLKEKSITVEAIEVLKGYDWPGNVRELKNIVERLMIMVQGPVINKEDLLEELKYRALGSHLRNEVFSEKLLFDNAVMEFEKEIIISALKKNNYVQTRTADYLGITRRILKYKMDMYNIKSQDNQPEEDQQA